MSPKRTRPKAFQKKKKNIETLPRLPLCRKSNSKSEGAAGKAFPSAWAPAAPVHQQSVRLGWMTGHLTLKWCQLPPGHPQWSWNSVEQQHSRLLSRQESLVKISNGSKHAPQWPKMLSRNPLLLIHPGFRQMYCLFKSDRSKWTVLAVKEVKTLLGEVWASLGPVWQV